MKETTQTHLSPQIKDMVDYLIIKTDVTASTADVAASSSRERERNHEKHWRGIEDVPDEIFFHAKESNNTKNNTTEQGMSMDTGMGFVRMEKKWAQFTKHHTPLADFFQKLKGTD